MSEPSTPSSKDGWNVFSPAENKLMIIVMKNMETFPTVNWDAVAEEYGYKDASMARQKFNKAKAKCAKVQAKDTDSAKKPASAAKGRTAKTKAAKQARTNVEDENERPVKRARKAAPKSGVKGKPATAEDDVDEKPDSSIKTEAKEEGDSEAETIILSPKKIDMDEVVA